MTSASILGAIAMVMTMVAYYPYIRGILRGVVKPHCFSWIIWGITTLIAFFAMLDDGGGIGAWAVGFSALITFYVAWMGYRAKGDTGIARLDWVFLLAALASLPVWYMTADPMWAVILLTTVDLLGFGPTIRKAFHKPYEEDVPFYAIFTIRNGCVIAALEHWSLTTLLFPVAIGVGSVGLIALILWRRKAMSVGQ